MMHRQPHAVSNAWSTSCWGYGKYWSRTDSLEGAWSDCWSLSYNWTGLNKVDWAKCWKIHCECSLFFF